MKTCLHCGTPTGNSEKLGVNYQPKHWRSTKGDTFCNEVCEDNFHDIELRDEKTSPLKRELVGAGY